MADWSDMIRDFVDEIAASVAMIGRDERGQFVVSACNDHFRPQPSADACSSSG
ncbi:hypothetical protein [Paraburkholderia sp. CNPSo 3281]|uniref:hypothetical protein n=1 Tax=Paraburkholderia sp. CNPSo 3281 TaxID=2940933 RepID=UPI0020B65BA0|nr:hypothetical protein [Paraburkholderia sp. CNPSo 3281]MCP3719287.1 hypothetical protein [Paraburkholderia sp. CNPSo 3281]